MAELKIIKKESEIRKIYSPPEEEMKVLRFTYSRKQEMADSRSKFESEWEKASKAWDAFRPNKGSDDWRSDIYIPLTTSIIESQLSEIIEQTLRPWVVERGAEDTAKAKVINAMLDYSWEMAKSDVALFDMIKDSLIKGTGIGMEYYWKQPRMVRNDKGEEKKVFEYDDCYLEAVRLEDFYIDDKARDFSGSFGARDAIRRYIMDYDDFRTFFYGKTWDHLDHAKLVKPGGDTNYYEFYKPPEAINHDREVEVLWYWNKPQDMLCVVANDVVVVLKPNPYKHKRLPFVRCIDVKVPYQFYGRGESKLLESLQEETNILRRMIIDRNHLDIDKPILVSDTLTIEDEDTITRPHGIIPVGDVNSIKMMEYSDIAQSVFKSLEMLNDDKIRVTGMDERQMSVSTAGTATEAAILKEATLKRLAMKMWHMKNDTLIDIGRLRVSNIMQFYSQPKMEDVLGEKNTEKYRTIRLQDQAFGINKATRSPEIVPAKGYTFFEAKPEYFMPVYGGFDIQYKASSSIPISKPLQQQKADEMYDRLITNPAVDPWKLAEYLLKSREVEPDEFKRQPQGQQQQDGVNLQKIVDLAGMENQEMMQGKPIKSTPYAPVVHTELHIEFIKSENFKKEASDQIVAIFKAHVEGEMMAQSQREGANGGAMMPNGGAMMPNGGAPGMEPSGAELNAPMSNVAPDRMMGGGETANVSGAQSQ